MALITLCGYPCSGKTRRAEELKALLERKLSSLRVIIVNEENLGLGVSAYNDALTEKPGRAAMLSATVRSLSKETITICDGLNYIKGFRYQLYCAAREFGCRTLTIHIATPPAVCQSWNGARTERIYRSETLENLISRFEEPSFAARWDSPLLILPWSDKELPEAAILQAIKEGDLKPPNMATVHSTYSSGDYLQLLDASTHAVLVAITTAQKMQSPSGHLDLSIRLPDRSSDLVSSITLPEQQVGLPQLQRHRRQYLALSKQAGKELTSAERIACLFLDYLQNVLN